VNIFQEEEEECEIDPLQIEIEELIQNNRKRLKHDFTPPTSQSTTIIGKQVIFTGTYQEFNNNQTRTNCIELDESKGKFHDVLMYSGTIPETS